MSNGSRLAGRTILLSGASGGIGGAVARSCAREGADLALTGRHAARLAAAADAVRALGRSAEVFPADARYEEAVFRVVAAARQRFGPLAGAVLNQGINRLARVEELSSAAWREILETNLTASFFFAKALAQQDPPLATVVFVASVSGLPATRKFPGFAAYCAAKRGVLGLAEVLALEWAARGTRVCCVCPRGVDTPMYRETFPAGVPELSPETVASAIVGLLDPLTAPPSGAVIEI